MIQIWIILKKMAEKLAINEIQGVTCCDPQITMSSLEIAKVTRKDHADVLKDIRRIFAEAEIDAGKFSGVYFGGNNQYRPCFNLP